MSDQAAVRQIDGPASPRFRAVPLAGNATPATLADHGVSEKMAAAAQHAPVGRCVGWGIPFDVERLVVASDQAVSLALEPIHAPWLVFLHTSDIRPQEPNAHGFLAPTRGQGQLGEEAAAYVLHYDDGTVERQVIRRRYELGAYTRVWGENCFEAVSMHKPHPIAANHEQPMQFWGRGETRASSGDGGAWENWLWAWRNPHPDKAIVGLRVEPLNGVVVLSGLAAGDATDQPLRWESRQIALVRLPDDAAYDPALDVNGNLSQLQLDMGQIISAQRRVVYPNETWPETEDRLVPEVSPQELLIEYTAHPDAYLHLWDGATLPLAHALAEDDRVQPLPPADQRVTLRVLEAASGQPVAVKLHIHGEAGQYLTPMDRHRIPNPCWFEDYAPEYVHYTEPGAGIHRATYIDGQAELLLPQGRVYLEISKGFEIRPIRRVYEIGPDTDEITITLERVLPWRQRGWVTADTHVHFLSPMTALLEGSAEGVNVVNLLASQWGELMTNVGDFDGKTTWGSREAGGDGEHLVRVGTENRQHVLGHISLLGYEGRMIVPMTTGGPDESALGDPIACLLTEWARQCRAQGGLVVLPHFPNPRAEHAASIVSGDIDGVEMTAWGDLYSGINPYSLSDWYRYLNCGYAVPAVGGTDKMNAMTAVGSVRTYARIAPDQPFSYQAWMDAVRRGETFVTYGPVLDFAVEGQPAGSRLQLGRSGGTVDVTWEAASVTVPMTRVELVVNGEIRESVGVDADNAAGSWSVTLDRSAWLALLVRGERVRRQGQPPQPLIAAHSSPVMVEVEGSQFYAAADAVTILEQIEGAMAYLDSLGTRAEDRAYKRMRLVLESAHRSLHNRMHQMGHYHRHNAETDHAAHH